MDGYVVFVPYTAPGDRVKARVYKSKSSHGEANLLEIVRPSESRIDALCPLFTRCGGCSWQHLPMDVQEHWKADIVAGALRQVKGLDPADVILDPIVSSPNPFHYRNKMEFTFGQEGPDAPLKIGFHMPGNWKHILDVEQCWLHPQPFEALLTAAREEGVRQGLSSWNPMRHEGMLRQLVVRWSEYEQRALVAILTGAQKGFDFQAFVRALTEACPQVKGIVWGLNSGRSDVARAEDVIETWGEDVLEEHLGSLKFQISLASFFQTNTLGAVGLYSVAKDYLGLTGCERLLDAYCGTGTIGLFCADQAQHVYGIEVVRDAIWDARMNATRNGIENTTFMAGDMASTLPSLLGGIEGPVDRLVVDPPRSGMDKKALAQLVAIKAPVLVYVSCNPTTMARDLQQIFDGGYKIERLRPVDMFPQTYHIECVARCVLEP
ncbi:23S rRNA (uracil(1939)-C(5))-methyltransferase RlmD [bacterium]|nr:23S rRNA (uracil(1939)-C(5))-methyltransferase RlmD [bacterium]